MLHVPLVALLCALHAPSLWAASPAASKLMRSETLDAGNGMRLGQSSKAARQEKECNGLHILTTHLVKKIDWMRPRYAEPDWRYFGKFYESVVDAAVNVTIVHDGLPQELILNYTTPRIQYYFLDYDKYDKLYGMNDVRFFAFLELVRTHPDWTYVFNTDITDVRLVTNPCHQLRPSKLYVGSESNADDNSRAWLRERFEDLGHSYLDWYDNNLRGTHFTFFNAGIMGGSRSVMLDMYSKITAVLADPKLRAREMAKSINVNMGVLNYVLRKNFTNDIMTGSPVHNPYRTYVNDLEARRMGIWFTHKLFNTEQLS